MPDSRPRLFVTRKLPQAVEDRAQRDYRVTLNADDRLYGAEEVLRGAAEADALMVCPTDKVDAALISALPAGIRMIATFSVGFDHVDLAAAKARGIVVSNTPEVLTNSTAETAMLLMLGAARRVTEGAALIREDKWTAWGPTQLMGLEVTGKRLGIVGMGRIGLTVARRARGFDMEIHYTDARRLPPEREEGATFHATIEEMLPQVDIVTLHCPALPETYHLMNDARLALLPRHAVVVNTARGTCVDDRALISALRDGRIGAAGLDVFEGEPNINPGYRTLSNVFLLPHLGSATIETRNAMGFRALDNLDAFFAGQTPRDQLN